MIDQPNFYYADLEPINLDDAQIYDSDGSKVEVDINPKTTAKDAAKTITEGVQADSKPQERALTPKEQILFTHPAIFAAMDPPLVTMLKENEIVCPFCGNGTGSDHTGVDVKKLDKGYKCHCFKCGKTYDNLDIYAEYYGLDVVKNFKAIVDGALAAIAEVPADAVPEYSVDVAKPKITKDYLNFINYARDNLKSFVDSHGGNWRGLTYETLKLFVVGYAPQFGTPKTPRVIIPSSRNHFLARFVGNLDDYFDADKIKPKQHFGTKEIYNFQPVANWIEKIFAADKITTENVNHQSFSPIFVVEGEIDAMSLYQLYNTPVISTCGKEMTAEMFNTLKENFFAGAPFIFVVMYDNDEAGITGAIKTAEKLNTIDKVTAVVAPLGTMEGGKYKPLTDSAGNVINDINDGLNINPEGTRAIIESTVKTAKALAKHLDDGGTLKNFKSIFSEFYRYAKASCDVATFQTSTADVDAFNASLDNLPPPDYYDAPKIEVETITLESNNFETCATDFETTPTATKTADTALDDFIADENDYSAAKYIANFFLNDAQIFSRFSQIKTGIEVLDEYTPFLPGLHFLGGLPGTGKTTLALQLFANIAALNPDVFVIYATNEMSRQQIFSKLFSRRLYETKPSTALTARDILRDAQNNLNVLAPILDYFSAMKNFRVVDLQGLNAPQIVNRLNPYIDLADRQDRKVFVFFDYLQLVEPLNSRQTEGEKINDVIKRFKRLQHESHATFIIISAFNRASYLKTQADLDSFRGTSGIEYGGETILSLDVERSGNEDRKAAMMKYPRRVNLSCLKNRNGALFDCSFDYYAAHDYFKPVDAFNAITPRESHDLEKDYYDRINAFNDSTDSLPPLDDDSSPF